ncbi:MAG: zinc-dependent alcohol dehydrogenase family protein [Firmicutes bacterium]|nr:zinc-dependent alcohol dehydrogenase family protein [Bacillota bacterium]
MKAMILPGVRPLAEGNPPLILSEMPMPVPKPGELLIQVGACGVCHTELDEIEGRTPPSRLPMVLGHQVAGRVVGQLPASGKPAPGFQPGDRVGVGWIHSSCGQCEFCRQGRENLCPEFAATGRDAPGGYAEYMTVPAGYAYPVPEEFSDAEAAPLLCAGGVGYRSLALTGLQDGQNLGFTGFGASGHLVLKLVQGLYPHVKTYVFTRSQEQRQFALDLGATWAGALEDEAPVKLQAVIDTTPVWKPIVTALANLDKGGRLVINAIRKENHDRECLLSLDYGQHLWEEKEIKSVANVTREDVTAFLQAAARFHIKPEIQTYRLEEANQALFDLKAGKIRGAKVIVMR